MLYMTTKDIAELLGLEREYVTDKLTKRPDFPRPAIDKSQRLRRWLRADVERWATAGRQCPRQTRGSTSPAAA
jgi:predicted DNA-binding transcriptional regulator AlpA